MNTPDLLQNLLKERGLSPEMSATFTRDFLSIATANFLEAVTPKLKPETVSVVADQLKNGDFSSVLAEIEKDIPHEEVYATLDRVVAPLLDDYLGNVVRSA